MADTNFSAARSDELRREVALSARKNRLAVPARRGAFRSTWSSAKPSDDAKSAQNSVKNVAKSAQNVAKGDPKTQKVPEFLTKKIASRAPIAKIARLEKSAFVATAAKTANENFAKSAPKIQRTTSAKFAGGNAQNRAIDFFRAPQKSVNSAPQKAEIAQKSAVMSPKLGAQFAHSGFARGAAFSPNLSAKNFAPHKARVIAPLENSAKIAKSAAVKQQIAGLDVVKKSPIAHENVTARAELKFEDLPQNAPKKVGNFAQKLDEISAKTQFSELEKSAVKIAAPAKKSQNSAHENPAKIAKSAPKTPATLAFNPFEPNAVAPNEKVEIRENGLKNLAKNLKKSRQEKREAKKISAEKRAEMKREHRRARAKSLEKLGALDGGNALLDGVGTHARTSSIQKTFAREMATAAETEQPLAPLAITGSGAAELAKPNIFDRFMNAKISVSLDVDKKGILAGVRVLAILAVIALSGYLAWDTWTTNRVADSSTSQVAGTMSIAARAPSSLKTTAISQQQYGGFTVQADQPRYVKIPSLNVNSRVFSVGVTSNGNIDTPQNVNDLAWYDGSAKPGQPGQVFVDGHAEKSGALAGVANLRAGDTITLQSGSGATFNYRVTSSEKVASAKVDMSKALNTPDGADKGLTIMAATGEFNYRTNDTPERFVVYAVQE